MKKAIYHCRTCQAVHKKWAGQCDSCGSWNSITDEANAIFSDLFAETTPPNRISSGIQELDLVCGGGLVPGAVILLGGDPGIGKSTLLLQLVGKIAKSCAYVSGEESKDQIALRAKRLGVKTSDVMLAACSELDKVLEALKNIKDIKLLIIDSIQTMQIGQGDGVPGSMNQVRACTQALIQYAKSTGTTVFLVGHVTKDGNIAGPKLLEHMVDTVLYFEGDRQQQHRIIRSVKNRFGPAHEVGIFTMDENGLREVSNPSELFLSAEYKANNGSAIFAGIEGSRPLLCEIQALVTNSYLAAPRRNSVGYDNNRLCMLLAVLESRCGLSFANKDVYLNIVGGLKLSEPAADLPVAAALISALQKKSLPEQSTFFGEIGLGGEIRSVAHTPLRLRESSKQGFIQAFCSQHNNLGNAEINVSVLKYLRDLL